MLAAVAYRFVPLRVTDAHMCCLNVYVGPQLREVIILLVCLSLARVALGQCLGAVCVECVSHGVSHFLSAVWLLSIAYPIGQSLATLPDRIFFLDYCATDCQDCRTVFFRRLGVFFV